MNRKRVIIIAALLALLGGVGPLVLTFYLSQYLALEAEEGRLQLISDLALDRSISTFASAIKALHKFDTLPFKPCSEAHIKLMRTVTITTHTVDDIGYMANGILKCNAGGMTRTMIRGNPVDFTLEDGEGVSVGVAPDVGGNKSMTSVSYKSHMVLIDASRFADIVIEPDVQLAVLTSSGKLLGTLHNPDLSLINAIARGPNGTHVKDDLFATKRRSGLVAIAIEPRRKIIPQVRREQIVLFPLGLLLAISMVGAVILFSRRRLSPLGELKIGIDRREFIVHYQPIIELKSGACVGAEALVRWQRPDGSIMRPDLFIPLAEESGLILGITDQVIALVIREMKSILATDHNLHIAINLSASDIKSGRALTVLGKALLNSGIQPQQIWLEVTERGFMDIDTTRATIERARALGYTVVIDDFGTGYSSLSYLQEFRLDALKIDKSFIDTVGTDSVTSSVTPHIIGMAKSLKLKIVAEGIETKAQADYLLEQEVEYGQGWLYAKALTSTGFIQYYWHNKLLSSPPNKKPDRNGVAAQ